MDPVFFPTPFDFRTWLEKHHDQAQELWVGYYKKDSGKASVTWPESVDEALCFGWIDGLRKSIDDISYKIRFTPRKLTSNWSKVNIERVKELSNLGRMHPAGLKAFEARKEEKSGIYAYEQRETASLSEAQEQHFQAHPNAWEFFQSQPNSYRKAAIWWVVSAKKEETRQSRLSKLIEDSAQARTIPPLTRPTKQS